MAWLAALVAAGPAASTSWDIHPVRLTLSPDARTGAMTLRNRATVPVIIQAEVKRWHQEDGQDVYTDSDDLIVSPPIYDLPPGGNQVVRVGIRSLAGDKLENAYRIFFREVPSAADDRTGLRLLLQVAVPIFVQPRGDLSEGLAWSAWRDADDVLRLALDNIGAVHVQIAELSLVEPASGRIVASTDRAGYVLPGQVVTWTLAESDPPLDTARAQVVRLVGESDRGPVSLDLPLGPPAPSVRP